MKARLSVNDYVKINLGEDEAELFERLILPYPSDGQTADRLVAIAVLNKIVAT